MTPDTVFLICNYGVLPMWLLLLVAPNAVWTQRLVHRVWIPMGLGLVYLWAFVASPGPPEGGNFLTLTGVMHLFDSPHLTVAGWVHYLVFDLFIGAWEARDAERRGIGHALLVPCLVLTLMLGPLGLLSYLGVRLAVTRAVDLNELPT